MQALSAKYEEQLAVARAELALFTAQSVAELAGVHSEHEAAIEALKKDYNKKSSTARLLLNEKEESLRTLVVRVRELEEEIFSGAPQERKIFELAQSQAKREATHGLHKYVCYHVYEDTRYVYMLGITESWYYYNYKTYWRQRITS